MSTLTPRELEVLRHIAEGLSDAEIASALSVALSTVHKHVQRILKKLGKPSRTGAAVAAVREGVIE